MGWSKKLKKVVKKVGKVTGTEALFKAMALPTPKNIKGAVNDPVLQLGALGGAAVVAAPYVSGAMSSVPGGATGALSTASSLLSGGGGGGGGGVPSAPVAAASAAPGASGELPSWVMYGGIGLAVLVVLAIVFGALKR